MNLPFPRLIRIRQRFETTPPVDIPIAVERALAPLLPSLTPGTTVAIATGSRGITGIGTIIETVVRLLKTQGAHPFVVPAMGSHGGATPEGQTTLLREYGIATERLHVPIQAGMEVASLGCTPEGIDVAFSAEALKADKIIVVNRIKPHTDFAGKIGSGLMKMMVVGLGKQIGAANYHIAASRFGYEATIRSIARVILKSAPILCGLAVVENPAHETAHIVAVTPDEMERREEELFVEAKRLMPKLPFDDVDLLIIDRIGKNISGSGMDPNITGRSVHGYSSFLGQHDLSPCVRRIFVRDLTPETHGNGIGIGSADFTTHRLLNAMDRQVSSINALTSLTPQSVKIPIAFETDREAIERALASLGLKDPAHAKVVWIEDTLSLEHVRVSEAYASAAAQRCDLQIDGPPEPMPFGPDGNLLK